MIITIKREKEKRRELKAANTTSPKNEAGKPWKETRRESDGRDGRMVKREPTQRHANSGVSCSQIKPTPHVI